MSNMSYSRISDIPPHSPEASLPIRPVHSSTPTRKTGSKNMQSTIDDSEHKFPFGLMSQNILNCPHPRRFFGSRSKYRWYRFLSGSFWPIQFRSRCLILGHAHETECSIYQFTQLFHGHHK
jgi:hypothetical protein